jgi:glycosyltransferase involved in cell wall biosynthesis
MTTQRKKVLFAGSLSASQANALGVQMLHLAEPFGSAWTNCYWYDDGKGPSDAPSAFPLYTRLPFLWPLAKGRGFVTRTIARFGIGWWQGSHIIERKKPRLRKLFEDVGFAYVAPFTNVDATRCREILQTLGCPFVVHIWDFLDAPLNGDYEWLFSHAKHVFYLSPTMIKEIRTSVASDMSLLAFSRRKSQHQAKHRGDNVLKIGLIGTLSTYQEGPKLLGQAVERLRDNFAEVRLRYIGSDRELQFIPQELRPLTECTGFLDDDGRDKALAECDVAFLPGPALAPEMDARSRHSVPSRSADYLAVGLPVIAAVHPSSATNAFFSSIQGKGFFPASEPEDIGLAAQRLRDEVFWKNASESSLRFFDGNLDMEQVQKQLFAVAEPFL